MCQILLIYESKTCNRRLNAYVNVNVNVRISRSSFDLFFGLGHILMHSPGTVPAEATLMPSGRRLHPILLSTPGALDSLSRCSRGRARVIWANWLASFRPRNSRLLGSSAGFYQNIFLFLNSYSCPPGSWIGELKKNVNQGFPTNCGPIPANRYFLYII